MTTPDERGTARRLKRKLPASCFRLVTVLYNRLATWLPFRLKYAIGGRLRRSKAPYRFLHPTDVAVQIGSARDFLAAGRSRAVHFSRLLPRGLVIVIEADAENCRAIREAARRYDLSNLVFVEKGAWSEKGNLGLLSSPTHPASSVLSGLKQIPAGSFSSRSYLEYSIDVDTVDNILQSLNLHNPRLLSITTNGAEEQILAGASTTLTQCEYVSLASTSPLLVERMSGLGYDLIADDDRGYSFRRRREGRDGLARQ